MLLTLLATSIIINEIAWMGTEASYNDEWIELYNNSGEEVNLEGWVLKADDGTPEINLEGKIPAKGFYLLERTDDETVPAIPADLIYKGALSNSGENLKLYDGSGGLAHRVDCADGWLAGDNEAKLTMERIESGDWQNSAEPGGTPKKENYELRIMNYEEKLESEKLNQNEGAKLLEKESLKSVEVRPRRIYPEGVVFNRVMPSPEGPDVENEWIEIYNSNDFEVDLSKWQIRDTMGRTTTYVLKTEIKELSSLILPRLETKITLNNSGDGLELINPDGEIVDSLNFGKALQGQAYIKTPSGWQWENKTSKTSEQTQGAKLLEKPLPEEKGEAKLIDLIKKEENKGLAPIFIAFIVALGSAGIVVTLKNLLS